MSSSLSPQSPWPLSVIVITRNEEATLGRCLESVRFAREIIVFDGESTDRTAEVARSFGAKVWVNGDWQGFGHQKNLALAEATQPWVLSLDADEAVTPELQEEIRQVLERNEPKACFLPRRTQFCGHWVRHCGWTPDRVLRLFPREGASFSPDRVHEHVICPHPVLNLKSALLHWSYVHPAQYWQKLCSYSMAWAQQRHAQGRKTSLTRAGLAGFFAFFRSYVLRAGFLDGRVGWMVCAMQAQAAYGKHMTLVWLCAMDAMDAKDK